MPTRRPVHLDELSLLNQRVKNLEQLVQKLMNDKRPTIPVYNASIIDDYTNAIMGQAVLPSDVSYGPKYFHNAKWQPFWIQVGAEEPGPQATWIDPWEEDPDNPMYFRKQFDGQLQIVGGLTGGEDNSWPTDSPAVLLPDAGNDGDFFWSSYRPQLGSVPIGPIPSLDGTSATYGRIDPSGEIVVTNIVAVA